MDSRAFSEVVESSLNGWVAHCWKWDEFPNAGTLVVIDSQQDMLFGIIRLIETGSIDPTRTPFAYQKTEEELRRDHPEIFSFLKTTCTCIGTGFCEKHGPIIYHQSPRPPKTHAFVRPATHNEQMLFFERTDYLDLLACRLQREDFDELLLAIVREHREHFLAKNPNLLAFFENYAHLINHDYARLRRLTTRVEALIAMETP
jgi:hypothetical protein